MSVRVPIAAVAFALTTLAPLTELASATPFTRAASMKKATQADIENIGWRRGWGWGVGAGIVGGALLGRALAAPYYYDPYYAPPYYGYYARPYYPGPAYYPAYPPRAYVEDYEVEGAGPVEQDAVAYCTQRFRSYDPGSGTYLGYDGLRHPCP